MSNVNSVSSNSYSTNSLYGNRNVLSGLATGMDTEAMIQNSVSGYDTKINQLKQKQEKVEWQQDAYRGITDKMIDLSSKYTSYTSSTNLNSALFFSSAVKSVTTGTYADLVSATGKSSSEIQINSVTQLATSARYTVAAGDNNAPDKTLEELGYAGDLQLTVNGQAIEGISADSKVSDIISAINSSDAGVKASYSSLTGEYSFTTKETGSGTSISFGEEERFEGLARLFEGGSDTEGQDAIIDATVNGKNIQLTRASNTFDMDGMSVTVKGTFTGGTGIVPVNISTQTNSDKIVDSIKSFVEEYNAIMKEVHSAYTTAPLTNSSGDAYSPLSEKDKDSMSDTAIEKYETKAKTGILYHDSDLSELYNRMRNIISDVGLNEIGLSAEYDNDSKLTMLKVDEDKLRSVLDSNPDKVKTSFAGDGNQEGIMSKTKQVMDDYASTSSAHYGILVQKAGTTKKAATLLNNTLKKQIDSLDEQITNWQTKMSSRVDYYTKMFTQLEKMVSTMNSQSSMLSGLMGG